jgi:hypothetical protein
MQLQEDLREHLNAQCRYNDDELETYMLLHKSAICYGAFVMEA